MSKPSKIIVGLGNPGSQYALTRHNVGQQYLDFCCPQVEWQYEKLGQYQFALPAEYPDLLLVKPQTYMNRSGESLRFLKKKYSDLNSEQLVVVHDDLDVSVGAWKMQMSKGPHGHNGLESLYQAWGSTNFWHLRIGIDGRAGDRSVPSTAYVLQTFSPIELETIRSVFAEIKLHLLANSVLDQ
jgi:PTH1 family peptidyl-tRNA hydrolase